jgi:hypothetical protein
MKSITINDREFTVEFSQASQGHRLTVMEYVESWEFIEGYRDVLCIGSTQFETLCNLSTDLFGEAVWGEDFARALGIPMITVDDMECVKCHKYEFYEDMKLGRNLEDSELEILEMSIWDYVCLDCLEAVKVGA